MVDHTLLFTQAVTAMKSVRAAGAIGTPRSVRAARRNLVGPRHASNLVWDLPAHDVAILDHVLDREPLGFGDNRAERCESRAVPEVVLCRWSQGRPGRILVLG